MPVTIINKEASLNASVGLSIPEDLGNGRVLRLSAPSLQGKDHVTFAGSRVFADGTWNPQSTEWLPRKTRLHNVDIPAGSAAVLRWAR